MAIVFENFTSGNGSGTSTTITKPTGLAEGDVMVVTLATENDAANLADQTGWTTVGTLLETQGTGTPGCRIYVKEATSGDVSGGNFTFTHGSLNTRWSIARVSGATITGYQWSEDEDVASTTTPTYTPGVTPGNLNSLLFLFVFSGVDNAAFSVSGYAIANRSLTWTERYDISNELNEGVSIAYATAPDSTGGATGDFSATVSVSTVTSGGLLAISDKNVTVTPAVVNLTSSVPAPAVTGGVLATPNVVTITATPQNPTVTVVAPKWVNDDKSDTNPTITNEPKS